MKITWYGHSCFLVKTEDGSVVFDPYAPGSVPGWSLPEGLHAGAVVCSHQHDDHSYAAAVAADGGALPNLRYVETFHDGESGRLRGGNRISVLSSEGLRLAHLGDLGHLLTKEQIDQIGNIDIALIPVGGFYTIDTAQAVEVIKELKPALVIPMHYRTKGRGYAVLTELDGFTSLLKEDTVSYIPSPSIEIKGRPSPGVAVLDIPVCE